MTHTTVTVNTRHFRASHCQEPRGRGEWAFTFGANCSEVFFARGTFTEARKAAVTEARKRGETRVYVEP